MFQCIGYAAQNAETPLAPFSFERRDPGPNDVEIEIVYCGVCHSDLHTARNEWRSTLYPCVPGHEIVGRVTRVGGKVSTSRRATSPQSAAWSIPPRMFELQKAEQYCVPGFTGTYNGPDQKTGANTYGGYSSHIVVDRHFVLRVPENLDLAGVAPLLCAGITTYSPLRHWKVGPGQKVGIVGLGGLGHMGLKIAYAMGAGADEVVISCCSRPSFDFILDKEPPINTYLALKLHAGSGRRADEVQRDLAKLDRRQAMAKQAESFDFILDTVAAQHDINTYLGLPKRDCTLVQVGAPEDPLALNVFSVIWRIKRRHFLPAR